MKPEDADKIEGRRKSKKPRLYTPPQTSLRLKWAIANKMGKVKMYGTLKKFADATGLDYNLLRRWVSEPVIPFLFADFLAFWLGMSLQQLMELGVRLTMQCRGSVVTLSCPSPEACEDPHFIRIVSLLQLIGCTIRDHNGTVLPKFLDGKKKNCANLQTMKDRAEQLSSHFAEVDTLTVLAQMFGDLIPYEKRPLLLM